MCYQKFKSNQQLRSVSFVGSLEDEDKNGKAQEPFCWNYAKIQFLSIFLGKVSFSVKL